MKSRFDFHEIGEISEFIAEKAKNYFANKDLQDGATVKYPTTPHLLVAPPSIYQIRAKYFLLRYPHNFLILVEETLPKAQRQYPELFGTGKPEDIIEALYRVEENLTITLNDYEKYSLLQTSLFVADFGKQKVLKLELFNNIYINGKPDFRGGLLHVFNHFTNENIPLSSLSKGNSQIPNDFISKVIEVWFFGNYIINNSNNSLDVYCIITDKGYKFSFHYDEENKIYFLNTVSRDRKALKESSISLF